MTKTEYLDWKSSPATQEVLQEIRDRIEGLKGELAGDAGKDPLVDRWRVGAISAFNDILNFYYDEVTHD